MNKLQAMAQIMTLLNADNRLRPGSHVYKMVRRMVSDRIDGLGPEGAVAHVMDRKAEFLDRIRILCMWHKSTRRNAPPNFW